MDIVCLSRSKRIYAGRNGRTTNTWSFLYLSLETFEPYTPIQNYTCPTRFKSYNKYKKFQEKKSIDLSLIKRCALAHRIGVSPEIRLFRGWMWLEQGRESARISDWSGSQERLFNSTLSRFVG